jgi:hypothetical protein
MSAIFPASQNKRRALYRHLLIGAIAVLAVLAFASRTLGVEVHGVTMVMLAPILALAALQLRALDEVARQAHFAAWYWGSFVGLVAIGAIALALSGGFLQFAPFEAQISRMLGAADAQTIFIGGLISGPVLMLSGYLIWSAIYWLRTR